MVLLLQKQLRLMIPLLLLSFGLAAQSPAVAPRCCDVPECKTRIEALAAQMLKVVKLLGPCNDDPTINQDALAQLQVKFPAEYNEFEPVVREILDIKSGRQYRNDLCFSNALPEEHRINVLSWLSYMQKQLNGPAVFPSSEFCGGWRMRFELGQGAGSIFRKDMGYIGSVRGYLAYTFARERGCDGRLRLLAGPSVFWQNNVAYMQLSTRAAYRVKNLTPKKLPAYFGNINVFGEYTTTFGAFHYAAAGGEVELGPFGVNLSVLHDFRSNHQGFLLGFVLFNKSLKKKP
ncbi:hypothetical protein ECE50_012655 [Chitinophaga sp. Mgbs1]|uniref:Uncharacterized protein n=1 Tax=Chitinophaga solisilvae TaxID=1233460 RepID=A0A9Q5DBW0_9BACT|nr:hypothetical protein [Chitinophaga solisilvae]